MKDKEIIYKFLKWFSVITDDNEDGDENGFVIFDKINQTKISANEFSRCFLKVFDVYKTDDKRLSFEICQEWLDDEKSKLAKEIDEYLNTCDIKFGDFNWEITDSNGNEISEETVIKLFSKKQSSRFVASHYDNWRGKKILDLSEKIMNSF